MLYEAASIDGAGKWKKIVHITLPSILPTVGILFILSMSGLLKAGYEQIILFQQPPTIPVSEVLETYSVKVGLQQGQYSYATVVGLFQSIVSLILIVTTNHIAKKSIEYVVMVTMLITMIGGGLIDDGHKRIYRRKNI